MGGGCSFGISTWRRDGPSRKAGGSEVLTLLSVPSSTKFALWAPGLDAYTARRKTKEE